MWCYSYSQAIQSVSNTLQRVAYSVSQHPGLVAGNVGLVLPAWTDACVCALSSRLCCLVETLSYECRYLQFVTVIVILAAQVACSVSLTHTYSTTCNNALQESYLSVLMYAVPALALSNIQIYELAACWNSVFSNTSCSWSESVKGVLWRLGRLNLKHLVMLRNAKFYKHLWLSSSTILSIMTWLYCLIVTRIVC